MKNQAWHHDSFVEQVWKRDNKQKMKSNRLWSFQLWLSKTFLNKEIPTPKLQNWSLSDRENGNPTKKGKLTMIIIYIYCYFIWMNVREWVTMFANILWIFVFLQLTRFSLNFLPQVISKQDSKESSPRSLDKLLLRLKIFLRLIKYSKTQNTSYTQNTSKTQILL